MGEKENTSTDRCSFRYLVAQIVLATDVPMPYRFGVFDEGYVSLTFKSVADAHAWASLVGAKAEPYINKDGNRYAGVGTAPPWNGWRLQINASEPVTPDDPLDEATSAALTALPEVES